MIIDVPEDIAHGQYDFDASDFWVDPGTLKAQARRTLPDPADLEKAVAMLAKAERPIMMVGGGIHISEGYDALYSKLAESQGIPVAHTMTGKGCDCVHPSTVGGLVRALRPDCQ